MGQETECITCIVEDKNENGDNILDIKEELPSELRQYIKGLLKRKPDDWEEDELTINGKGIRVKHRIKQTNRWVFYWASSPYDKSINKMQEITEAYGKYKNKGLKRTNMNGEFEIVLECPQPYKVDGVIYPAHIHYIYLYKDNKWNTEVNTLDAKCIISKDQLRKIKCSNDHIIINSMESGSYDQSIDGSISIPNKTVDYRDSRSKKQVILKVMEKKDKRKKLKDIDVLNVPIIIYGDPKDTSSIIQLRKKMNI